MEMLKVIQCLLDDHFCAISEWCFIAGCYQHRWTQEQSQMGPKYRIQWFSLHSHRLCEATELNRQIGVLGWIPHLACPLDGFFPVLHIFILLHEVRTSLCYLSGA